MNDWKAMYQEKRKTPEEVAKSPVSYTGKYVEKYL